MLVLLVGSLWWGTMMLSVPLVASGVELARSSLNAGVAPTSSSIGLPCK